MEYKITEQFSKRFFIDLGLRPEYEEDASPFSVDDIKGWYTEWQKNLAEKEEPYFAGIVTATNFVYAFSKNGAVRGMNEPAVRIEGEVSKEYHADIFDDEKKILGIIFNLAKNLGSNAKQKRVHVMFDNRFFVLE